MRLIYLGIPNRLQGRFNSFWECILKLRTPEGCALHVEQNWDNSVARSRNVITRKALSAGAEAIIWLDDDQMFSPDTVERFLVHPEPIVLGLTMTRMRYDGGEAQTAIQGMRPIWSDKEIEYNEKGQVIWTPVDDVKVGPNGMKRLTSGTNGGVMTRCEIFEKIEQPWWQQGQLEPDMFWEDIYFYNAARRAGFEVWGDPSIRFGHDDSITYWPYQDPATGEWYTVMAHGVTGFLTVPWKAPETKPAEAVSASWR